MLLCILGKSYICKMPWKNFENNGKNIGENIVKLKLEQNIKSLLYKHLVYVYAQETDFCNFTISLSDKTENPLSHRPQLRISLYLVITRLKNKERLRVCDHKITLIMTFTETSFQHSCINRKVNSNI